MELTLLVIWALLLVVLTLVGTPVAMVLFRPLPRRGAALGLPVALAWLTLGTFWIGHWRYTWWTILVVLVSLAIFSLVSVRRLDQPSITPVTEAVVLLVGAFIFMSIFRALDPAVVPYAGEKFLDYSLVRGLLRTDALPPVDPWFAGEPVRYYYGGHLLVASLAEVTTTSAPFAYNLGFATIFSAVIVTAYGVGSELADEFDVSPMMAGVFAAAFVALAGNLASLARLIGWVLPGGLGERWASWFNLGEGGLLDGPFAFFYWDDSRVAPAAPDAFDYLINEFPLFAFVHGDLHAHVMATPFLLLLVAGLFAIYRATDGWNGYRWGMLLGFCGGLVSILVMVNTWSVITGLGLITVTLFLLEDPLLGTPGPVIEQDSVHTDRLVYRFGGMVLSLVAVAVIAVILALPFVFETRAETGIGLLPHRTPLSSFLLIYGAFLTVAYLAILTEISTPRRTLGLIGVASLVMIALLSFLDLTALVIFGLLVAAGFWLILARGEWTYTYVLLIAAAGLVLILEFVYVNDPASWERLNTLFKLGYDAWVLWGVVAGVLLADLFHRSRPVNLPGRELRLTGVMLAVVLFLVIGLYGGFVFVDQVATARDDPTLDATVYLNEGHPTEAPAIGWLDERSGTPVIVEAPGTAMYQWSSPASSYTGLPTVVGWQHAANYHADRDGYNERVEHVRILYEGSPEERAPLLERYDVRYLYVGPSEHARYDVNLDEDPTLTVVFEESGVRIYSIA